MTDDARGISDVLFGRPPQWKVFISSQMAHGALTPERIAAAEAVEAFPIARAWYWERDAHAGPYSSDRICIGEARTSDGLVLLLAESLRPMVLKEYRAASDAGTPCYIMLKEVALRHPETNEFVSVERPATVTRDFGSLSELKSEITQALYHYAVQAGRRDILRRRAGLARRRSLGRRLAEGILGRLGRPNG